MRKSRFIASFFIFVAGFALCAVIYGGNLASLANGILARPASPAQNSSKTQLWEYCVATKYSQPGKKWEMDYELSQFGDQGFEIYSVTQSSSNLGSYVTVVLRRPKR
jgi:hypothetical protein